MARPSPTLKWCVVRFGDDMNWWVDEISDEVHWDVDGLGIIDPRQLAHIIDLCDPLREYGFDPDLIDQAFFAFRIEKEVKEGRIRLTRVRDQSLLENEDDLFALPDVVDEEKGPYADFLDQISRFRVKMLNDQLEFDENLTVDELEEEIRERQNADYFEGRAVHFFNELTAVLEYVPEGFELDLEEESSAGAKDELEDIPDFEEEESIEEDETMRWDEDEDEEDEDEEDEEGARRKEGE